LPSDIPTLPALLSELGGYSTAMAGKWHLGHAQHKMTPIGRGFEYFTGQ
jgi:arylsulfatase A-like enzyme